VRHAPSTALRRGSFLIVYTGVVIALAVVQPLALLPLAAAAACATVAEAWLGRAGSGGRSGLPPGRLPLVPVAPLLRRDHIGRLLRHNHPVAKGALPPSAEPVACLRGLEHGADVLRHEEHGRLQWHGIVYDRVIPAGYLRSMMPPDHTEDRRVIGSVLSTSVVDACRPEVGGLAGHAVSALADASRRAERRGVDPRPHLQR
jgi:hypothetical protein